jgi:anaerobic ribonucleoside-triphosphate reductase activating protein
VSIGTLSTPARAARSLRVGGLTPFSSVDWPGQLAAVVFVQGCPWRCGYCHNPHLQPRRGALPGTPSWDAVLAWLPRRVGLLDGVVFSGGEPTIDPELGTAMRAVRALGLRVGLHTAGMVPRRLQAVLPLLDWVGLDIKAPLADGAALERITGVPDSAVPVQRSLQLLLDSGVDFECRTTAHPSLLSEAALCAVASELAAAAVPRWALQITRRCGCATEWAPVSSDYPSAATLAELAVSGSALTVRRA